MIELASLPSMLLRKAARLPAIGAVYVVLSADGDVLYVGQSSNLQKRWKSSTHQRKHELSAVEGAKIAWLEMPNAAMRLQVERELIQTLNPALNGSRVKVAPNGTISVFVRMPSLIDEWLRRVAERDSYRSVPELIIHIAREAMRDEEARTRGIKAAA